MTVIYIPSISERIKKELNKIYVGYRPPTKLQDLLVRKRPAPAKKLGTVYNIPCSNCNWNYVGETSRPIEKRRREHEKKVRDFDVERSEIARHVSEMGHNIGFEKMCVLLDC